jgi:DNA gyrase subunit A
MSITKPENRENSKLLVITENGFGKKTPIADFKIQNRGGSGIKAVKVTDKTGPLVGAKVVLPEHSEVIAMSEKSQVIRTSLDQIATSGRDTQGVTIMKFKDKDDRVVSFVRF